MPQLRNAAMAFMGQLTIGMNLRLVKLVYQYRISFYRFIPTYGYCNITNITNIANIDTTAQ